MLSISIKFRSKKTGGSTGQYNRGGALELFCGSRAAVKCAQLFTMHAAAAHISW